MQNYTLKYIYFICTHVWFVTRLSICNQIYVQWKKKRVVLNGLELDMVKKVDKFIDFN